MRIFRQLCIFHLKRILKNPKLLLLIIFPVVTVSFMAFLMASRSNQSTGDFVIDSQSEYFNQKVYPKLLKEHQQALVNSENQLVALEQKEISIIYQIPQDFESTGRIIAQSLEGDVEDQYFQEDVHKQWYQQRQDDLYQTFGLSQNRQQAPEIKVQEERAAFSVMMLMILFMIFYFMYLNASILSGDLLKMKLSQVLKRSIVSEASNWMIMASLLLTYGFLLLVANLVSIFALTQIFQVEMNNLGLMIALLAANIIFVLGYIMALFRVFKSVEVLQSICVVIGIAFVFLPMFADQFGMEYLGVISPFYWVLKGLEYSTFWPYGWIIILMGLVLFTAGSIKLEQLVARD